MTEWFAEHEVVWILPSGERRPGRIAIGLPEVVEDVGDEHRYRCAYVLEGVGAPGGHLRGSDTLQALYWALMMVGHELYWMFSRGVRVLYPQEGEPENPDADTASLISMLGPLIRAHGNPRGVADAEGKIADLERLIEEERRRWEGEP